VQTANQTTGRLNAPIHGGPTPKPEVANMSKSFVIKIEKKRERNPLGAFQERKQIMRDRRNRRPKDARRQREHFDH
jgi:hypothetical protein